MNEKLQKLKTKIIQQTIRIFNCKTANIKITQNKEIVLTCGKEERQLIIYSNVNDDIWIDNKRLSLKNTSFIRNSELEEFIAKFHLVNDFLKFLEMFVETHEKFSIKELRENRRLTQKQLAEELGTSTRNIQKWENVGVNSAMSRKLISLYFNVSEKSINFETRKDCGFKNKFIFGKNKEKYVLNHLASWMPFFDKILILSDKKTFNSLGKKENINIIKSSELRMNPIEKAEKIIENNNKNTLVVISLEEYYHLKDSFYKELFSKNNKIVLLNEFEKEINFEGGNYELINTND